MIKYHTILKVRALEQNMTPEMALEEERTTLALHAATNIPACATTMVTLLLKPA